MHEVFSPIEWSIMISNAKKKVALETNKIPPMAPVERNIHSCQFDGDRMEALERQVEELTNGANTMLAALTEMNEELAKAQGMLKFCYAICQNPGIKEIADANRARAASSLGGLSFGGFGRGNGYGGNKGGGGGAPPRAGLGSAGRP